MKWFFKIFFRSVRAIVGPLLLLWDKITTPRGIVRSPAEQAQVDERTKRLLVYQFKTCPFCIKVRRAAKRLSLNLEYRDAQHDESSREQLQQGGGQIKVPCLRMVDESGAATWLYESNDIVRYLQKEFG